MIYMYYVDKPFQARFFSFIRRVLQVVYLYNYMAFIPVMFSILKKGWLYFMPDVLLRTCIYVF